MSRSPGLIPCRGTSRTFPWNPLLVPATFPGWSVSARPQHFCWEAIAWAVTLRCRITHPTHRAYSVRTSVRYGPPETASSYVRHRWLGWEFVLAFIVARADVMAIDRERQPDLQDLGRTATGPRFMFQCACALVRRCIGFTINQPHSIPISSALRKAAHSCRD